MSSVRAFRQKLSAISRLWEQEDYDSALAKVEELLKTWPGNSHLHVLWASLVQLQQKSTHELDEAKQALHRAIELDSDSPEAAIELGHFLDAVEDNPDAAVNAYSEGIAAAHHLLIDGLIGQAKAFLQLNRREDALHCLSEVIQLLPFASASDGVIDTQSKSPLTSQLDELLSDVFASRSA
ncbi:MAG: tetratricopeptide repeat protein [Planctomycetes bacterium]|nr:tetratricopeptide repeat protein [Planctomycetota bacterium]